MRPAVSTVSPSAPGGPAGPPGGTAAAAGCPSAGPWATGAAEPPAAACQGRVRGTRRVHQLKLQAGGACLGGLPNPARRQPILGICLGRPRTSTNFRGGASGPAAFAAARPLGTRCPAAQAGADGRCAAPTTPLRTAALRRAAPAAAARSWGGGVRACVSGPEDPSRPSEQTCKRERLAKLGGTATVSSTLAARMWHATIACRGSATSRHSVVAVSTPAATVWALASPDEQACGQECTSAHMPSLRPRMSWLPTHAWPASDRPRACMVSGGGGMRSSSRARATCVGQVEDAQPSRLHKSTRP